MLLIADSGSTKTDWCLAGSTRHLSFYETKGINPYFYGGDFIAERLKAELPEDLQKQSLEAIHFYGAGSSTPELKERVIYGLSQVYPNTRIQVEHDLLGSARALCGDQPGIATILGTGSNACEYDGKQIKAQSGGIGFILGDEGSGTDLGRRLLQHYFYHELPYDLHQAFEAEIEDDKAGIIDNVYRQPNANRYLAGFAHFLGRYKQHPSVWQLVKQAFTHFLTRHVQKFDQAYTHPVYSVGSIAHHFHDIWQEALASHQLTAGGVITRPIDYLATYHLKDGKLF